MSSIVLVDDHTIVMDSLKYLIESGKKHEVIEKFKNGSSFLEFLTSSKVRFDLAIIDIKLPDFSGLELAKELLKRRKRTKCILLSQFDNCEFVYAGLDLGVSAYLLKSCPEEELILAIEKVLAGEVYLSPEILRLIQAKKKEVKFEFHMTDREKDILNSMLLGFSNKEIAEHLEIEITTVEFHKRNLKKKLNVSKSVELVIKTIELGLVNGYHSS